MRRKLANPDQIVARIASRQHGVISLEQLQWAGLSHAAVLRRVRSGRLHRLHRGVYAVGHTNLSREGRWMAAVLACGKGAVLSHRSAAALWGISPTSPQFAEVTVPRSGGRAKRPGIMLHRSRTLTPSDSTRRHNIPVTTHARTLLDLGFGPERTRSYLERRFLALCRRHDIPRPEVNVAIGPYTADFLWRPERLIVEADSWRYHGSRGVFESDRARDRELKLRGFEIVRFAYREVIEEPDATAASLNAHLARRRRIRTPA